VTFRHPTEIDSALSALKADLLAEQGPQISTVRNYNFAILPYPPDQEFPLRRAIDELSHQLRDSGWNTDTVDLHKLLLRRLRRESPDFLESLIVREKALANAADGTRRLRMLKEKLANILDTPEGLAADVVVVIEEILSRAEEASRSVIFLGRLGALYPFMRTSALLKHVAGKTHNAPVVLLYPGRVVGETGLSFMGVLAADRDYRPRIYR
jgi:hypothetical protein